MSRTRKDNRILKVERGWNRYSAYDTGFTVDEDRKYRSSWKDSGRCNKSHRNTQKQCSKLARVRIGVMERKMFEEGEDTYDFR